MELLEMPAPAAPIEPDRPARTFYVHAMRTLDREAVPYLVGGGYAMAHYTGIARNTKDLDLFLRPADRDRALEALEEVGYKTELFYPFWIAKALSGEAFIDILYNSGNGLSPVDDTWFERATENEVLGHRTRLVPVEEQLWTKAFVQDRDRFDGADVVHLIYARGPVMDWERLLQRFTGHERVLLAHLHLYAYVYPSDRDRVPNWVVDRLNEIIANEPAIAEKICRGPFLAQRGYGTALTDWGYADGRLQPHGPLTAEEIAQLPEP